MNTTAIGIEFEDKVFDYFSSLLEKDELNFAPKKYSKIFKHKRYSTDTSRKIEFDITIETYNPLSDDKNWSSLIVIECKSYGRKVDIADFDEFESKLKNVSNSAVKGILVTKKGFSIHQIEKARKEHIALVVLSDTRGHWIVSRDINREPEDMMPILLGDSEAGIQPVVYDNGIFDDIINLLQKNGVQISNKNIIDIPRLKKEQLLDITSNIHKEYGPFGDDIAGELLFKKFPDFRIDFEQHPKGILGLLYARKRILSLSYEIINDIHRRNFTIAHEIGHLILHIPLIENKIEELTDYDIEAQLSSCDEIIRLMETQANKFASYLLLPEKSFIKEIDLLFKKHNITKGILYLDNQPCNINNFNMISSHISRKFNISKAVVKYRMLENSLLIEPKARTPRRIRDINI